MNHQSNNPWATQLAAGVFTKEDLSKVGDLAQFSDADLKLLEEFVDSITDDQARLFRISRIYNKISRMLVLEDELKTLAAGK